MTVDKSESRIRTMFGEIAGRYDFLNHLLSGGVDYYWRWRTVRKAPPQGESPILDVCTGTGDLALAYWKRGKGKIRVVGSDFTHQMLIHAGEKATKLIQKSRIAESAAIEFVEADTQQLPFDDNQFQLVTVAFGLRNVTDTRKGLREMTRVCQPGGRVAVLEFSLPRNWLFRNVYLWYFRNILPIIGQLVSRNRQMAYSYLPQSVAEFPQGAVLAGIMQECGLGEVTWTPMTFGIATLYIGRKPEASTTPQATS